MTWCLAKFIQKVNFIGKIKLEFSFPLPNFIYTLAISLAHLYLL